MKYEKDYLIGVVVPAYNAQKTLHVAIDSVLEQSFKSVEIVIVDDGSADSTGRIADQYAASNANVRVIHESNQGCYMAKRAALQLVRNRYFTFLDADDRLCPGALEKLVSVAEKYNADVVEGDFVSGHEDTGLDVISGSEAVAKRIYERIIVRGFSHACTCGKLYKNRIGVLTGLAHVPITTFEDMAFNMQFLFGISTYVYCHEPVYDYRINEGSSVRNFGPNKIHDFREILRFRNRFFAEKGLVHDNLWAARNAWNYYKLIATANGDSMARRIENGKELLSLVEVRKAFSEHRLLKVVNKMPVSMVVNLLRCLYLFSHCIRSA